MPEQEYNAPDNADRRELPSRLKKLSRLAAWIAFSILVVYWIASAIVLNTGVIPRLVNTWRDGHVDYRWAFSPIPGVAYVSGFEIRHQDRNVQWTTRVSSLLTAVDLPALARHQFHAWFVKGGGVEFRLRLRESVRDAKPDEIASLPPFPGIPPKPRDAGPAKPESDRKKWGVKIERVSFSSVEEAWVDRLRFSGQSSVRGGFEVVPDTRVSVGPAEWRPSYGTLSVSGQPVADELSAGFQVLLHPFDPNSDENGQMRFLDIDGKGSARLSSLRFLNLFLHKAKWVRAEKGEGKIDFVAAVKNGKIARGTSFETQVKGMRVRLLGDELAGTASVTGSVKDSPEGEKAEVDVALTDFTVTHPSDPEPHVLGEKFEIHSQSDALLLASAFSDIELQLVVAKARLPRLELYNRLVPKSSGVAIVAGKGEVSGKLWTSTRTGSDRGALTIQAQGAEVTYNKARLTGNVALSARLAKGSVEGGQFDVSGSEVKLTDVSVVGAKPGRGASSTVKWWGNLRATRGLVEIGSPTKARAQLDILCRDARPFLTLLSAKNEVPSVLRRTLSSNNLKAAVSLRIDDKFVDIREMNLQGGGLNLLGRLRFLDWAKRAVILVKYGPLAVGVERNDDDTRIVLNSAEAWYFKRQRFSDLPLKDGGKGSKKGTAE